MYKILTSTLIASVLVVGSVSSPTLAAGTGITQDNENLYKDISPQQRSVVTGLPEAPAGAADGLRLNVNLDRESRTYRIGETLSINISVNEDAYVEVWNIGTSGNVTRVFPNTYAKDNHVKAGQTITVPGANDDYVLKVMQPQGKELVTVFASDRPLSLTEQYVQNPGGSGVFAVMGPKASVLVKDIQPKVRQAHPRSAFKHSVYTIEN